MIVIYKMYPFSLCIYIYVCIYIYDDDDGLLYTNIYI